MTHAAQGEGVTYFEHYKCGCTSPSAPKNELPGYCPEHGESMTTIYPHDPAEYFKAIANGQD